MRRFQKKPLIISAMQYTGNNLDEVRDFVPDELLQETGVTVGIKTLEGVMIISEGDYVIKGIQGEFYPCKSGVFEGSYDEVL